MNQEIQENVASTQEDTLIQNTEGSKENTDSITLSLKEYEEYKAYKASKESEGKNLTINERISKELSESQARLEEENKLLSEASRTINGIALSSAFKINDNLYIALVSIFGNRGLNS
ncbi:DUF1357 family protein (plasmid) [Borrelia coriaceae]|uniref:Uncharacterized protein n=1 Tax=Borrelia coriaceae ATCC 43381 TaxID=1408429 RepID=W5T290_9SPIR|nr:DUF1357 family protein [Borrelia coriaceae]AHH11411.1 Hypothetical protein BCO_0122500 [Borrelia coriaceae ATCC 43381]UPA16884.1 DUF1357 family protein [Borrelia coriaceae]